MNYDRKEAESLVIATYTIHGMIIAAVIGAAVGWYIGAHFDVPGMLNFTWEGVKIVLKNAFMH